MNLRQLDDLLLPRAAVVTRRFADWWRHTLPFDDGTRTRRVPPPRPPGPAPLIVRLRDLDDRYAHRAPMSWLREVPQLGALALAGLVFVGGVVAVDRAERQPPPLEDPGPVATAPAELPGEGGIVGPQIGQQVPVYIATATRRLQENAARSPDSAAYAVVSYAAYTKPTDLPKRLTKGVVPLRVLYRVKPLPGRQTVSQEAPVRELVRDTHAAFDARAKLLEGEARNIRQLIPTVTDPAFLADYRSSAESFEREVQLLRGRCACVYAVVVRATYRVLRELLQVPGVRVVDAAPPRTALDVLDLSGLFPEERVTVTRGNEGVQPGG